MTILLWMCLSLQTRRAGLLQLLTCQSLSSTYMFPLTTIWNFRSLVRARADAEALEARAHAAEAVEAGLQSELRAAEAAGAEADAALARCQALEERLSELRAEQVANRPATPRSQWQIL